MDRSLEALAMQAVDWRTASGASVQIHVLVIFDGFDKVDKTMWTRYVSRMSAAELALYRM